MARKRASSIKLRKEAFERDKGICAVCAADCEMVKRVFNAILDFDAQCFYSEILGCNGQAFWEADHVIEVASNGSDSPRNIQTLCIRCHTEKTRLWQQTRERPLRVPANQAALRILEELKTMGVGVKFVPPNTIDLRWVRGEDMDQLCKEILQNKPQVIAELMRYPNHEIKKIDFIGCVA